MKDSKIVLIIDDDEDLCQMLKAILSPSFESVEFTHTLESGKKLLSTVKPDVIFLDNNLPDGQGVSLIKSIKEEMPSTTVILITAMDNAKEDALKYGADIFLGKPLTFTSIKEALNKVSQKII